MTIKEIEPSKTIVWLNIINLETILFGINLLKIQIIIFSIAKVTLKLKWNKVYNFLFILISITGFSIHLYLIFKEIITNDLVDSGYLKKLACFKLPTLCFCFKFEEEQMDEHNLLNGRYLNKFTQNLTYKSIFKQITYYNKLQYENLTDYDDLNSSSISLDTIFYYTMKCFCVKNSLNYSRHDLYFKNNSFVMQIYLNTTVSNTQKKIYILYNNNDNKQFNEIYAYRIGKIDHLTLENKKEQAHKYRINLEPFDIETEDKFQAFKNPKILFSRKENLYDLGDYLEKMKAKFNLKYNLTTRVIPLVDGEPDFEYDVNEMLFEQFYLQIQNYSDHQNAQNNNLKRNVYNFYTQRVNYYFLANHLRF